MDTVIISEKNCEGRWNACDKIGRPSRITAPKTIVEAGIPVMGNVGLSPQSSSLVHLLHPRTIVDTVRKEVVETAVSLQEVGCFSVLLEYGPAPVAVEATAALSIPTIGIEEGPPFCGGQASQEVKPDEHLITKTLINYKVVLRDDGLFILEDHRVGSTSSKD